MPARNGIGARRRGARFIAFGCCLALALGCSRRSATDDTTAAAAATRPKAALAAPAAPAAAAAPAPEATAETASQTTTFGLKAANDHPAPPAPETAVQEQKPPRDFGAELEAMMTQAKTCLSPRATEKPPPSVAISVTANVMPSGAVTRGEVDARGLSSEESECLKKQLESLHFAEPIENAPFAVNRMLQVDPPWLATTPEDKGAIEAASRMPPVATEETPGIVPPGDPGVVPPEDQGVVPPADPGVVPPADPGVVPPPDPPAYVLYPTGPRAP